MSIDKKTIDKISSLAKIKLDDQRALELAGELSNILNWIDQLNKVDTKDIPPLTGVVNSELFKRDDLVDEENTKETVLSNSPETSEGFFVVPKVVDS